MTMEKIQLSDFAHVVRIPTRWSDLDLLGHVNNTRYFTFDEDARLAYFETLMKEPGFWKERGFILAHIEADFLAQLHHPAELAIGLRVARLGRSSMNTQAAMFNGDTLVATTRGTIVWFDYINQKPMPIPESVRAWIRGREVIKPEE
jgi:acyl-CoA thioester hydrolase